MISTHAPLAGSDSRPSSCRTEGPYFNPRSPCGERRKGNSRLGLFHDISTHAPLAGSDIFTGSYLYFRPISTHAPLAGSDRDRRAELPDSAISTHAPLAGSDATVPIIEPMPSTFQPTLPLRGATGEVEMLAGVVLKFQPTLPLRGATAPRSPLGSDIRISTHAPLAGSDVDYTTSLNFR